MHEIEMQRADLALFFRDLLRFELVWVKSNFILIIFMFVSDVQK